MSEPERTWFSELSGDQVRTLLENIDCIYSNVLGFMLLWVQGQLPWYADKDHLIGQLTRDAAERRQNGEC